MVEQTIRRFKLSDKFVETYRDTEVPWGPLGYVTYKRTYARRLDEFYPGMEGTEEWFQTCRRVIEGMFNMQKQHIVSLGLEWNDAKAQRTAKDAYDRLFNLKWTPPGRGLWMMGTKFIEERTAAGLFNCWRGDTKILTRDGFKRIDSLVNTDQEVMVDTGAWVKAPIRSFGKQLLYEVKLKHQSGYEKTMYATAEHRWFARENYDSNVEEYFTKDLKEGSYLQLVFGQGNKTTIPSPQGIQAGIVYGDGTLSQGRGRVVLCGKKNEQLANYFPLNTQNSYDYISDEGSIIVDGLPAYYKDAPPTTEMRPYLYGWLMGYFAADGTVEKNGQVVMSSTNRKSLELFKDIAAICGIGTLPIRSESRISNLTDEESILYKMTILREKLTQEFFLIDEHKTRWLSGPDSPKRSKTWKVVSVSRTNAVEEVYCATVDQYGHFVVEDHILSGNCAFRSTEDIDQKGGYLFGWMMDALMVGIGVGFDTKGAGKIEIQQPASSDEIFVIPDDREGWVESVIKVLDGFFFGHAIPKFDYSEIRPAGSPIKGFGGTASGSGPLEELHRELIQLYKERLNSDDRRITSTDIVDTENLIGKCVVAGNVRRSAALALGAHNDMEYLTMKNDQEKLMNHRWGSNNSFHAIVGQDYTWHAAQSQKNGEPGYIWLDNARTRGRFKDGYRDDDLKVAGFNPCVEQQLESAELCCLVETFPAKHDSYEDYLKTLKVAYLYGKTVTLANTHWPETNAIMLKNRRIGLSQSGVVQAFEKFGRRKMLEWCDHAYNHVKELDKEYSDWMCIPRSVRMTSIKPSGTVSLLNGSTPGIHYPEDEFYIRRIRFSSGHALVPLLEEAGYPVEDCIYSPNTKVASFPVHEEHFVKGKREVSMWEQLEIAAQYQYYWADNSVSVTITFKPEEADQIKTALEMYDSRLKAVSFLRYEETGYEQAPYEPITEEKFNQMTKVIKPLDTSSLTQQGGGTKFCDGEYCEI